MRLIQYLKEEYVTLGKALLPKSKNKPREFEVHVNPTSKEIQELSKTNKEVRYIADFGDKRLYVWDADFIHMEGMMAINDDPVWKRKFDDDINLISTGVAKIQSGKLKFIAADAAWVCYNKPWSVMPDKWLDKWFIDPYTKTYLEYHERTK